MNMIYLTKNRGDMNMNMVMDEMDVVHCFKINLATICYGYAT